MKAAVPAGPAEAPGDTMAVGAAGLPEVVGAAVPEVVGAVVAAAAVAADTAAVAAADRGRFPLPGPKGPGRSTLKEPPGHRGQKRIRTRYRSLTSRSGSTVTGKTAVRESSFS
jgi:hypothetical protein